MLNNRQLAQCALFIALISVSAHLKIPIPVVPITFQMFMVIVTGLLLNRTQILYVMIGYIGLGLIGLPVFASGAGFTYVLSPSFGFVIGFVFLALIINHFENKLLGILVGYLVLYAIGLPYLLLIVRTVFKNPIPLETLFLSYWVPFMPSDALSIGMSLILYKRLKGVISVSSR